MREYQQPWGYDVIREWKKILNIGAVHILLPGEDTKSDVDIPSVEFFEWFSFALSLLHRSS